MIFILSPLKPKIRLCQGGRRIRPATIEARSFAPLIAAYIVLRRHGSVIDADIVNQARPETAGYKISSGTNI